MTPCRDCGVEGTYSGMGDIIEYRTGTIFDPHVCEYYLCYECYKKFDKERNGK